MGIRARGANAILAAAFASSYGQVPGSGYRRLPFVTSDLGEMQGLVASDLVGYGRDPLDPSDDVVNDDGNLVVPLDLRNIGFWLKMLFGPPTSTQGVPAKGTIVFSANPVNNATVTINATVVTFVTGAPTTSQVKIGATLADTLANLILFLNASADANISPASYTADDNLTTLRIIYDTVGTGGNAFTIAASSSPASNGTVSAATLAGGAATGQWNHVFTSGQATLLDAAIEVGFSDASKYYMNYGVMADSLAFQVQRSGLLNATLGMVGQGELPEAASTGAGTPAEWVVERFSQFMGSVKRDGVPLGRVQSSKYNYANGLEKDESVRSDGRIAGIDPGEVAVSGEVVVRFGDSALYDLAVSKTPVELVHRWEIAAGKSLEFKTHRVRFPKPKKPITGPGGVQATMAWIAAQDPVLGRAVTATLVNDVTGY